MNLNQLIDKCIRNDQTSQQELYRLCYKSMINTCIRFGGDYDGAGIIFNNAMLRIFGALENYSDENRFWGWVKRIVINCCIDYSKAATKDFPITNVGMEEELYIAPDVLSTLSAKDIRNEINKLPRGAALVFNLYIYEGYTHKQISEALHISEGTSKSQLSYARKLLFQKLNDYHHVNI